VGDVSTDVASIDNGFSAARVVDSVLVEGILMETLLLKKLKILRKLTGDDFPSEELLAFSISNLVKVRIGGGWLGL
jgi:hypothetical protein